MSKPARIIRRMLLAFAAVVAAGLAIIMAPLAPLLGSFDWLQTAVGALVIVCGLGKLLYDTLFYDRYS